MTRRIWPLPVAGTVLLLAAAWCYHPGLSGGFLFDDYANLPSLGASGPIDNAPAFWRYITSGIADPTGRPLTLLTFLLDARDWPADPAPFLLTNLLLHLLNGMLLVVLLRRLGRLAGYAAPRADLAAAIGAGLWLLHPLFVSTTLYIVQREAMLPATCVLLGLLAWLKGRALVHEGDLHRGVAWMLAGLGGGTLLGVLAKANGALLPLYAWLIEGLLLAGRRPLPLASRRVYRTSMGLLAWLPSILLLSYLVWMGVAGILHGVSEQRGWTLGQRLLTEPRVLIDYLGLLWFPRPFTAGLFNDQWQASTGLLAPPSTLVAILAVAALLACAWWLRRRQAALALAIAFFFAGQLIESTTIALELYFEHRNYVPAMLMFWPLALWLANDGAWRLARRALAVLLLAGLALMTHAGASLWGNQVDQALLWARLNPDSPRAQAFAAQTEMQRGRPDLAAARLVPALRKHPDEVQLALNLLAARCASGGVDAADLQAAETSLRTTRNPGSLLLHWFERGIDMAQAGTCRGFDAVTIRRLLDAAMANPYLTRPFGPHQDLLHLFGALALAEHDGPQALGWFDRALALDPRAEVALKQAAMLGTAGLPGLGLAHLDYYAQCKSHAAVPAPGMPRLHAWVMDRQQYWQHEMARMRATLQSDAAEQAGAAALR